MQKESETTRSHVESYLKKGVDVLGDNVLRLWFILTINYVHVQPSLLGIKRQMVKLWRVRVKHGAHSPTHRAAVILKQSCHNGELTPHSGRVATLALWL